MDFFWDTLIHLVLLLAAALALGAVLERLRQSAILGYLAAGMLLGPGALNYVSSDAVVSGTAELGVSFLLFSIGLEFSWSRLRSVRRIGLGGGTLQVLLTGLVAAAASALVGLGLTQGVAVGAMVALSSTTCVLRSLLDRAELESVHGRNALGILLLQDIAVVPLVLLLAALGRSGSPASPLQSLAGALALAGLLVAAFYALSNYVLPRLFDAALLSKNRELPILLAVVTCLAAAWAAHAVNLSPAFGAFVAGMLLAESPFATQIRADVGTLRTLFVTLFFVSIGMLAELAWIPNHLPTLAAVVAAIVVGKALIAWLVTRIFQDSHRHALATGVCLAQVGEFSFVLGGIALVGGLMQADVFRLMVAATVATMFLTPFLVACAPLIGAAVERGLVRLHLASMPRPSTPALQQQLRSHVVVVGFGPAGREVVRRLQTANIPVAVVELNPRTVAAARAEGIPAVIGDASQEQVLTHVHVAAAQAVVVTVPDHRASLQVITQARALAPQTRIISRARYHTYADRLAAAGAHVVDEEQQIGQLLGLEVLRQLREETGSTDPQAEALF